MPIKLLAVIFLLAATAGCSNEGGTDEVATNEPTLEEQYEALMLACRKADEFARTIQFLSPSEEPGWDDLPLEEQQTIRQEQNAAREAARLEWEAAKSRLAAFEREHPLARRWYVKDSEKSETTIKLEALQRSTQ